MLTLDFFSHMDPLTTLGKVVLAGLNSHSRTAGAPLGRPASRPPQFGGLRREASVGNR